MNIRKRQSGLTLTELLVVMAVMAVLLGISVPTAQHLMHSFESSTGVKHLINAALSNARAIAVRNQAYAGVRFQEDADGNTYMIFIVRDESLGDNIPIAKDYLKGDLAAYGFRTVPGRKPMKLPEDVGLVSGDAVSDDDFYPEYQWKNANTFSVIFSPMGKLIIYPVRVWNQDGVDDDSSNDTIFNTATNVDDGNSMFRQDDEDVLGLSDVTFGPENSTQSFIMYNKKQIFFEMGPTNDNKWIFYFSKMKPDYISPYTGELVMEYNDTQ